MTASLAVVATIAAVAAAGAGARPDDAARAHATTVTLSGWASSPEETALLQQVIAAFQRTHPDISVNYAPISGDYPTAMLSKFAARTPPDVFYVDSNVAPDWIKQGVLEPLNSYIRQSKFNTKKFYPRLLSAFQSRGQNYGFPKDWSPLAMEINVQAMTKAKIKAPTNWAQLTAAAKKLARTKAIPGGKPLCLSADWARLLAFVYQNNGSFLNAAKTAPTVQTAAVRQAVNYYISFIRSGLAATPAQLGVGWCGEALGKAKAAIIFEGNWVVPYMNSTFPQTGYRIYPMIKNKAFGNLAFTVSYSIARDSRNKQAAWTLLTYLTGQAGMRIWTSKGLALPSRSDVRPLGGRTAFLSQAPYARPWQFAPGFSKVIDTAGNELNAVFERKQTVNGMLAKIAAAARQALGG